MMFLGVGFVEVQGEWVQVRGAHATEADGVTERKNSSLDI